MTCSCKLSGNDCGGYRKPKGHLDTQLFPECKGKETDRDVVRKNRKRKKKASSNDIERMWMNWKDRLLSNREFVDGVRNLDSVVDDPEIGPALQKVMSDFPDGDYDNAAFELDKWMKVSKINTENIVMAKSKKQAFNLSRYLTAQKENILNKEEFMKKCMCDNKSNQDDPKAYCENLWNNKQ